MNKDYHFETRMEVRDYECDIEGIVNNAQYIHYCEHTRHLFLKQCGLSFAEMHAKGVDAVVARMQLQYKVPLRPDDEFISRLRLEKEGIKYVFHQDIYRASSSASGGRLSWCAWSTAAWGRARTTTGPSGSTLKGEN